MLCCSASSVLRWGPGAGGPRRAAGGARAAGCRWRSGLLRLRLGLVGVTSTLCLRRFDTCRVIGCGCNMSSSWGILLWSLVEAETSKSGLAVRMGLLGLRHGLSEPGFVSFLCALPRSVVVWHSCFASPAPGRLCRAPRPLLAWLPLDSGLLSLSQWAGPSSTAFDQG